MRRYKMKKYFFKFLAAFLLIFLPFGAEILPTAPQKQYFTA